MEGVEAEPRLLMKTAGEAIGWLGAYAVPTFVCSALGDAAVATVVLGSERTTASSSHLLWEGYRVPADAAGWLYSVVGVVEALPVSVSVVDMRLAGCPLVYVNQEF